MWLPQSAGNSPDKSGLVEEDGENEIRTSIVLANPLQFGDMAQEAGRRMSDSSDIHELHIST